MWRSLFLSVVVWMAAVEIDADPMLQYASSPSGPWEVDSTATVTAIAGGNWRAVTSANSDVGFYRLMGPGPDVVHCPLSISRSGAAQITMDFLPGDLDADGDGVADGADLCPGYDDRLDADHDGIPDGCDVPLAPAGMALVPAGEFRMGDSIGDGAARERPVHAVYVSAVYVDIDEVTLVLWEEVRSWAVAHGYTFDGVGKASGPAHPVVDVSWYDAVKWCNARSEKEGLGPVYKTEGGGVYRGGRMDLTNGQVAWTGTGYRLPTEAEWEKAARGALVGRRYPWGDEIDGSDANYWASGDLWDNGTAPVGTYPPNAYGLRDMAGNALEWCWDWYDLAWYGRPEASTPDPRGPDTGSLRIHRGGSWVDGIANLRCAERDRHGPAVVLSSFGFRCVRSAP